MENPILLFDGVCNLCSGTVQFIIEHDKKALFRFASLQSEAGQNLLLQHQVPTKNLESVVLIHKNRIFTHSDAPLEIAYLLGGFWRLAYVFKIIPSFFRNGIYNWIARNRYRWFGKEESCWLPTAALRARFL
jgi:predicted DCC family thiol-disulfide oxidoreductase YuxK